MLPRGSVWRILRSWRWPVIRRLRRFRRTYGWLPDRRARQGYIPIRQLATTETRSVEATPVAASRAAISVRRSSQEANWARPAESPNSFREAETGGEIQRLRILNNVRMLFYQVLTDQQLVDVRQKLAKLSADATQTSHQLANVGQADRPDVLQAEVEQQQVNVSLRVAQKNLQSSWRTLAAVVGKPDLPQARLEGDLEVFPT